MASSVEKRLAFGMSTDSHMAQAKELHRSNIDTSTGIVEVLHSAMTDARLAHEEVCFNLIRAGIAAAFERISASAICSASRRVTLRGNWCGPSRTMEMKCRPICRLAPSRHGDHQVVNKVTPVNVLHRST